MPEKLTAEEFLCDSHTIIDVRSPEEFDKGHICGAYNIPLFQDDERKQVGILYKNEGKQVAFIKGIEFVSPKMAGWLREIALYPNELYLYCARGGMRSRSLAWLFEQFGKKCHILEGGYKSYRTFVLDSFKKSYELLVLGGKTGSKKTYILQQLEKSGEQVIDLEHLANHRGSAFGGLGCGGQPTTEMFENQLFHVLYSFDKAKTIWVEDESRTIGKVILPSEFFYRIRDSRVIFIEMPTEVRIVNILIDYGHFDREELCRGISQIAKRLGYDHAKRAIELCREGELKEAVRILLVYYDRTYDIGRKSRNCPSEELYFDGHDINIIVQRLLTLQKLPKSSSANT